MSFGFQYDSQYESQFIYKPKGMPFENEYRLDENGIFIDFNRFSKPDNTFSIEFFLTFENEYRLDENGIFVPGVTTKEEGRAYVKKM